MPTNVPISGSIKANERLFCTAPGCSKHRHKLFPFCRLHYERNQRTGSPLGCTPSPKWWRSERAAVADLFRANAQHPGMARALVYLQTLTQKAINEDSPKNHWQGELARVVRHGVSTQEILIEVCAAWSYLQKRPVLAPSDRASAFWVAHAVLKLAPRPLVFSPTTNTMGRSGRSKLAHWRALEGLGKQLLSVLAPLLVNVENAISNQPDLAAQATADMRAVFNPSPAAIVQANSSTLVTQK